MSPVMLRISTLAFVLGTMVSCAQVPTEMTYFPGDEDSGDQGSYLWPALPEVPRYHYMGQLVGEQNFGASESSEPGRGSTFRCHFPADRLVAAPVSDVAAASQAAS